MRTDEKAVCQSMSLPAQLARRVRKLAKIGKTSINRVLVELIETGIKSKEMEMLKFNELADLLTPTSGLIERKRIKEILARKTFGE
jgi:hypothetical protein